MTEHAPRPTPKPLARSGGPVRPSGGSAPRTVVLSLEDVERLLRAPCGPWAVRDKALLSVAYHGALRVSELSDALVSGIDFQRGRLSFWRRKVRSWHDVSLGQRCLDRVAVYLRRRLGQTVDRRAPMFLSRNGNALSTRTIQALVARWASDAGIPKDKRFAHILRHSKATHMIEAGVGLYEVQNLLGHERAETTSRYLHCAAGILDAAAGLTDF